MNDVAAPRCRFCGGPLSPQKNTVGARACLDCGKGTTPACGVELDCGGTCQLPDLHDGVHDCDIGSHHHFEPDRLSCGKELPCGGRCFLPKRHPRLPCMCRGDVDKPGTCPANPYPSECPHCGSPIARGPDVVCSGCEGAGPG